MNSNRTTAVGAVIAACSFSAGIALGMYLNRPAETKEEYSLPDQKRRFALHKKQDLPQAMHIDQIFDGTSFKDKFVVVTGGNRGIGLALVKRLHMLGAKVIATTRSPAHELEKLGIFQVVEGVDVCSENTVIDLVRAIKANGVEHIDVLVNNAGYFYGPVESLDNLEFEEEMKMIDICAIGSLRVTAAFVNSGLLKEGSKIAMITSQGGSIAWRDVQNPHGQDYGHHMSKAASNMMGKLVSQELREAGIPVYMLHPGFNRTDMTSKYQQIWDEEGAVTSDIGAKRVLHEISKMNMSGTGSFINCEDGLLIPW